MPSILVSGASVAGPALAHWMATYGWDVTVVERAERLRPEGQNIDIRGVARRVVDWMGLEEAVRAANTGETGTEFVDADGQVTASFAVDEGAGDGPTAELEILRGSLARVLCEHAPESVAWRFDDHIERLGDDGAVTFAGGEEAVFDVVAIAEGQGSTSRELVFDDVERKPLGVYFAYATIPRADDDTRTWRWYNATKGRQVHLRPDDVGTTRAMLGFLSDERGLDGLDRPGQVQLLREVFADVGWQAPRILAALDEADLYFEDLAQIVAPAWSRGRVVLVGDSAHCVTPLGGGGTSLALIGAYVLAQALAAGGDPGEAFAGYERFMRPHAERAQDLPPGTPRLAFPKSRAGLRLLRAGEQLAASDVAQRLLPEPASNLDEIELSPPR